MNVRWKIAQWFEAMWWRQYLRGKTVDDYLTWKKNYWRAFIARAGITISPGENLLDAGCGPAGIFTIIPDNNKVTAIDPLLGVYEQQLPHFEQARYPQVQFEATGLEQLTEKDRYDKVFCLNAINHVSNLDVSLQQIAAAVAPGGRLFLTVDAHNTRFFKYLFRLIPGDILHPHQLGLDEYKFRLKALNLQFERELLLKKGGIFNYYLIILRK